MVCTKPRVLIIDDEQVVCDVLYEWLSNRGYLCTTALNGADALTKLAAQDFDIALLDIKLPGMSGMEVLRKIQSNHHNTTVIMLTAINNVDTAVETMKLGASDYIVKPFELGRVDGSIRMVLESKACLPEIGVYQPPPCVRDTEEDSQTLGEYYDNMNAIALGVEARHDLLIGHSKTVAQEIISIARQLEIPEKVIQKWAVARARHYSKKNAAVKSSLNKLERSPLAQKIMGMTELHLHRSKPKEYEN